MRSRGGIGRRIVATVMRADPVGVRSEPKDSSPVIATYFPRERVNYDSFMNDGTYVWIHYRSYSGADRYMVCREYGTAWGSFS